MSDTTKFVGDPSLVQSSLVELIDGQINTLRVPNSLIPDVHAQVPFPKDSLVYDRQDGITEITLEESIDEST